MGHETRIPLYILDEEFETQAIIDAYISFIWTERYNECGDFELKIPVTPEIRNVLKKDRYVAISDTDRLMIIENLETGFNVESGDVLTVSGRSAECLLERRIIWGFTKISGNLGTVVTKLISDNAVSPSDSKRQIPGLSQFLSGITMGSIDAQYFGENLYETVEALCKNESVGFKTRLTGNRLYFQMYQGVDRSYDQTENQYVVFSSLFGNLISSTEYVTDVSLKNVCLIAGEGEGSDRKTAYVGEYSGLNRREIFSDGSSVTQKTGEKDPETGEDVLYSDSEYATMLRQHGREELIKHPSTDDFDAEVSPDSTFRYGTDYDIGDIVTIVSPYSEYRKARVIEYIRSSDDNGYVEYPTFQFLE